MNPPINPTPIGSNILGAFAETRNAMSSALATAIGTIEAERAATAAPETTERRLTENGHPLGPTDWDGYIGQAQAKAELRIRIHSAHARGATMASVLLTGGAGVGKTTLAGLIAAELDLPLLVLTKPCSTDALIDQLWNFKGVLFFDEVHLWGARASNGGQHAIMQLMEDGTLDTKHGRKVELPGLTFIAGTTNPERLFGPLRERFSCRPRLVDYTDAEMADMVAAFAGRAGVPIAHTTCIELGRAAASRPRAARDLVEAALDLYMGELPYDTATVLAMTGVDPDGLTPAHRLYLTALSSCPNGTAGLQTLSAKTELPIGEIMSLEKLLVKRGLFEIGHGGRRITPEGRGRALAIAA